MVLIPARAVAVALGLMVAPLQAATIPYLENFNDDAIGSGTPSEPAPESGTFSASGGSWSVVNSGIDGRSYNASSTAGNTSFGASVDFTGSLGGAAATAEGFIVSSQFRVNSIGTFENPLVGLGFLGTSSSFSTGYFVDVTRDSGSVRFVRSGTEITASKFDAGTLALDQVFTLTVKGVYIDTNSDLVSDALQLTASVSGAGLSGSTSYTDTAPLIGTRFGYRHRNSTNGSDLNVDLDNFSVTAVPEPGSAMVAGLALGGLLLRRRNRA